MNSVSVKLNSKEFMERKFPVEFLGVDEFTLSGMLEEFEYILRNFHGLVGPKGRIGSA